MCLLLNRNFLDFWDITPGELALDIPKAGVVQGVSFFLFAVVYFLSFLLLSGRTGYTFWAGGSVLGICVCATPAGARLASFCRSYTLVSIGMRVPTYSRFRKRFQVLGTRGNGQGGATNASLGATSARHFSMYRREPKRVLPVCSGCQIPRSRFLLSFNCLVCRVLMLFVVVMRVACCPLWWLCDAIGARRRRGCVKVNCARTG